MLCGIYGHGVASLAVYGSQLVVSVTCQTK
jgi:hypothetical protein